MPQDAFRNRTPLSLPGSHAAGGQGRRDRAEQESISKVIAVRGGAPKPLPAGIRLRKACVCGRRIPEREQFALVAPEPCPECGSILRTWERQRAGIVARLVAWIKIYRWKKSLLK